MRGEYLFRQIDCAGLFMFRHVLWACRNSPRLWEGTQTETWIFPLTDEKGLRERRRKVERNRPKHAKLFSSLLEYIWIKIDLLNIGPGTMLRKGFRVRKHPRGALTCLGKLPSFQAHILTKVEPTLSVAYGGMKQPRRKVLMRHGNAFKTFHDSACFESRLSAIYCARKSWNSKMPRETVRDINDSEQKNSLPADRNELFYFHLGSSVVERFRFEKLNFLSSAKIKSRRGSRGCVDAPKDSMFIVIKFNLQLYHSPRKGERERRACS